jgi:malate/lactate dehydrogenase
MDGVGREIVPVDKNEARAVAETHDLRHAVPFAHPLAIRAGDYEALAECRVVLLCAGVGQRPGETRLQLVQKRQEIDRQVRGAACTFINGKGVLETFPLPLNPQETLRLRASAQVIRQALNGLEDKDSHTKTAS